MLRGPTQSIGHVLNYDVIKQNLLAFAIIIHTDWLFNGSTISMDHFRKQKQSKFVANILSWDSPSSTLTFSHLAEFFITNCQMNRTTLVNLNPKFHGLTNIPARQKNYGFFKYVFCVAYFHQQTVVNFINCFAPYAYLLRIAPNFCSSKKLLKSWA